MTTERDIVQVALERISLDTGDDSICLLIRRSRMPTTTPKERMFTAAIRAGSWTLPLFDPIEGEQELAGHGDSIATAHASLREVLSKYF